MPVLRDLQRLVPEVSKRGEQHAVSRVQQVRQADEKPAGSAGVLQLHQVQPPLGHKPPQQSGERGHGGYGSERSVFRFEEAVAGDEGHEELPVAGGQHEGDHPHDASLSALEPLEDAPGREGPDIAETTREPSLRRGEQVLSR